MTRRSTTIQLMLIALIPCACSGSADVASPTSGGGQGGAGSGAQTASVGAQATTSAHASTSAQTTGSQTTSAQTTGSQTTSSQTTGTQTSAGSGGHGGGSASSSVSVASSTSGPTTSTGTGGSGGGGTGLCDPLFAGGYEADFDIKLAAGVAPDLFCINSCLGISTTFALPGAANASPGDPGECEDTPCDTCRTVMCAIPPKVPCTDGPFPTAGSTYRWDGGYSTEGGCSACQGPGCGPALACQNYACAPPGHYTATFCVTRAAATTTAACALGTTQACATVGFDLPSTTPVTVEIGP